MAERKNITEQIAKAKEDIRQKENQLKQLQKLHNEKERKARNHRLCSRGGYLESKLPEVIPLTDEQYYSFLEMTLFTENARRILSGLTAATTTPKPAATSGETGAHEAEWRKSVR